MPATGTEDISSSSQGISGTSIQVGRSRRRSSAVPTPLHPQPLSSRSKQSETPITPEESPPFQNNSSRKRSADALDQDDDIEQTSPSHTRDNSGDSSVGFCLCQPEPKVPRPRNGM